MKTLEYLQPKTIEEALGYLQKGIPLAGGTTLIPRRHELQTVVDLQYLDLGGIKVEGESIDIGATTTLQTIVETKVVLPDTLRRVCQLEAGWNMRNRATIGGAIMSSDGRSPLLTGLLALNVQIVHYPGPHTLSLIDVLKNRDGMKLITNIRFERPTLLLYDQVSRAPADFPLISAAVGAWKERKEEKFTLVIGGFGTSPIRLEKAEKGLAKGNNIPAAVALAKKAYASAEDKWASSEYRSEVIGILVQRLLKEVFN